MLMLNWISSACIVEAGQAGPLYVNTTISMAESQELTYYKLGNKALWYYLCLLPSWPTVLQNI